MDRQQIAARIRALFSKTVSQGATEHESAAAAAKAKELLDKYQMEMSELDLEEEGTEHYYSPKENHKRGHYEIRSRLCQAIAEFSETKTWLTSGAVVFFGLKSDTDFASWLLDSLELFVKKEADRFKLGNLVDNLADTGEFYCPPLQEMNAFRAGCIDKIKERLRLEAAKRKEHLRTESKNGIIVLKNQIVTREYNKLGLRLGSYHPKGSYSGSRAYSAGQAAGGKASFGRPVNGSGRTLRIGKN